MSRLIAQLRMACLFGAKGVLRRRSSFWPLWLALAAAVIMLVFMDATGLAAASDETHSLTAILGASDVKLIYRTFLLAGVLVCLLQSQLLILRALREERRQLLQLTTIGIHPRLILLAKGIEYALHAFVGALIGGVFGALAVVTFLPSGITTQALLWDTVVTLTGIPTTLFFVGKFLNSSQRQHDILI